MAIQTFRDDRGKSWRYELISGLQVLGSGTWHEPMSERRFSRAAPGPARRPRRRAQVRRIGHRLEPVRNPSFTAQETCEQGVVVQVSLDTDRLEADYDQGACSP
jgi:hypothetical protein